MYHCVNPFKKTTSVSYFSPTSKEKKILKENKIHYTFTRNNSWQLSWQLSTFSITTIVMQKNKNKKPDKYNKYTSINLHLIDKKKFKN